jgi:thymidylate synthase ThyX
MACPPSKAALSTEVFAIYGVEPEILAYAMAKYSRSALSLKESLREISEQKAEKFLNTFYFQYGHRSIADLAHIAFALERLSLLAAIAAVDEQRWDGQERSTRYQDFSHPDYCVPGFGGDAELQKLYGETIEFLFSEYRALSAAMFERLCAGTPRPAEMKPEAYERTLRARAFDIARYLLPLATNTSLGQIVSARTLETQISRLLSSPFGELRELGEKLKAAAKSAAHNVHDQTREVRPAPTLVKYAEASPYLMESRKELAAAARQVMGDAPIAPAPPVDLLDDDPVEIELATTLLYEHCQYSYRQIRERVQALGECERRAIVDLGVKHRGAHDELLRAFCCGGKFRFDILMDIGGFRDMHRHRRCIQIGQDFTFAHGFDTPADVVDSAFAGRYAAAMQRAADAAIQIASRLTETGQDACDAQYMMPLAYRKRTLFKMDFAEAVYISDLRTAPAGHFSYRQVAWQMFQEVARKHPELAGYFRVHDPNAPWDLLQR